MAATSSLKRQKIFNVIKSIVLFLFFILYMMPFILIVINSFKTKTGILKNPLSIVDPKGLTLDNFVKAFEKMDFMRSFTNSLIVTVVSVLLIVIFASMTAYLFVRVNWKATKFLFVLMIAGMIIPFQAIMIPLVSIYGNMLGILNSKATLIFMNVGFGISLAVFIYHGFIKSNVPLSLEEAAKLDGCNKLQIFFLIVFPLLKSITSTIVILDVLWIWNDYLLPSLVLTQKENFTLPLSTYTFYGTYTVDYGAIMAALVLTVIPVIVLYIFLQKHIISGVISGAVKA